ncbi:MAG: nuclear transport factor 2 family protein [Acidobacteria bacterium]|nr:nuclear transport factor 2 family protein [Acidobacteriota bacterium]
MARLVVIALLCCACLPAATPEEEIRAVLEAQTEAWNRGDIEAFMTGYEDSPETTFVGKEVRKGYASVLARYRRDYPTRARMGETTFSDIEVRMVRPDVAIVLGRFALKRPADQGGDASGIFSLVFRKTAAGWKIVLDHTS